MSVQHYLLRVRLYEINWLTSRPYNNQTLPLLGETGNSSIINNMKYKVWVDSPRWTAKLRQTALVHQKDWLYEKSWFIFGLPRYPKSSEVWKKNFFFIIWRQHKQTASEPEIPFYYFFEFLRLVLKLQCFDWSSPFMAHLVNWCGLANWNSSPRWTSLDSYKFHLKGVCYFTEPSKGTVWFWYSLEVSYIFVSWVIHFHH